jgi:cytochrome c5
MKNPLRTIATVLVVALVVALMLVGAGCKAKDEPTTPSTGTTTPGAGSNTGSKPVGDATAGEEALAGACTTCHDVTRIYIQPEMTDWDGVVARMESAHGAVLTDQQKADIAAFLASRQPSVGEQLIQGKCTTCHNTTRIYEKGATADWDAILKKMVETHGAKLTAQEQADVAAYLKSVK